MNPSKWFEEFLQSYRTIIDERYSDREALFPYYEPVEVVIYQVDDPRKILPEVVVFFERATEMTEVSGLILVEKKKIEWPENFDGLSRTHIDTVYYESFPENRYSGFFIQEAFSNEVFSSKPKDQAEIMVQKQLMEGLKRESFSDFSKTTEIRKQQLGNDGRTRFLLDLSRLTKIDEEQKADLISQAFRMLGFETVNLEQLKNVGDYRKLNQVAHVDVFAFMIPHRILVAIEEGEMNKERWYKKDTISKTLDTLKFLGRKEDWKTVIFLAIGRESPGIHHLEGDIRVISHDLFVSMMQDFFEGKRFAPALDTIEKMLGYNLKFSWK